MRCFSVPIIGVASAALLSLGACQQPTAGDDADNSANASANAQAPQIPQIPVPEAPVDREQLLMDALQAATDFATAADGSERQKELDGKKFEVRVRFGCDGPGADGDSDPFGWTYNAKTKALKVRATPNLSKDDQTASSVAGDTFEAVEGFWVPNPWLLAAACPVEQQAPPDADQADKPAAPTKTAKSPAATPATDDSAQVPPSRILGIAQFYAPGGPRTQRRSGRAYEATKKLEGDAPTGGFDLVLSGRLKALPDGRVIACAPAPSGGRPACIVSVEMGTVSIERVDTHEVLAHWGTG